MPIRRGEIEPAFPNARYVMWERGWAQWTDPESRDELLSQFLPLFRRLGRSEEQLQRMAEGRTAFGENVLPALSERVERVSLGQEFIPGFRLIDARGHRSDQVGVAIRSGEERLLHVADAVRHPVQIAHPVWNAYLDSFAEEAAETRRALAERAAQENALLFAAHLAYPGLGHVRRTADGLRFASFTSQTGKT